MNKSQSLSTKYELPFFIVLTYLLSWWSAPLMNGQIIPHGPTFAAIIVLALTAGRRGLDELWRRVTHWRVPFVWFIAGPALILGYHVVGFVINLLLGAELVSPPRISPVTFIELLVLGGLWEEPGWSGYLLPKMKERFGNLQNGLLIAALVTGVFRGQVSISRPADIASLQRAGYQIAHPNWDAFMVKPLFPHITVEEARALFGIGTDRFLISWLDTT